MKKVLYKKWIPRQMVKAIGNNYESPVPGTGCYESDFTHPGEFLLWGNVAIEGENNIVSETVALIKNDDGTVEKVAPECVKFVVPVKLVHIEWFMSEKHYVLNAGEKLTFPMGTTDEEIVEYFEEKCGGVYKWRRVIQ